MSDAQDEIEKYDAAHGRRTLKDEQRLVNLGEGANKPPAQEKSFKVSGGK